MSEPKVVTGCTHNVRICWLCRELIGPQQGHVRESDTRAYCLPCLIHAARELARAQEERR